MTGMDTVTKPTIVVDLRIYANDPDVQWHVNDRAEFCHLVLVVPDATVNVDAHDVAWDMVITNTSHLPEDVFNQRAAKVLHGTALQPGLVFTYSDFMDDWYAYGAAMVMTEDD